MRGLGANNIRDISLVLLIIEWESLGWSSLFWALVCWYMKWKFKIHVFIGLLGNYTHITIHKMLIYVSFIYICHIDIYIYTHTHGNTHSYTFNTAFASSKVTMMIWQWYDNDNEGVTSHEGFLHFVLLPPLFQQVNFQAAPPRQQTGLKLPTWDKSRRESCVCGKVTSVSKSTQ